MISKNSSSYSEDNGRLLEDLVLLYQRRKTREIRYFLKKGACDFVTYNKGKIEDAMPVCHDLNPDNLDRELHGIFEVLEFFDANEGKIITLNQNDLYKNGGRKVSVIAGHEFLK